MHWHTTVAATAQRYCKKITTNNDQKNNKATNYIKLDWINEKSCCRIFMFLEIYHLHYFYWWGQKTRQGRADKNQQTVYRLFVDLSCWAHTIHTAFTGSLQPWCTFLLLTGCNANCEELFCHWHLRRDLKHEIPDPPPAVPCNTPLPPSGRLERVFGMIHNTK